VNYRFYLRLDEGLRRVTLNAIDKRSAAPRLAGTRQMAIEVLYEWRGSKLFLKARGLYFSFNKRGVADFPVEDLRGAMELVSIDDAITRERRQTTKVASIDLRRQEKALESQISWAIPPAELNLIKADLMGKLRPAGTSAIPLLKTTKV
jgi:hypothetical protein